MDQHHSIFKAAVEVYNQSDCDKLRDICERYELPVWNNIDLGFDYVDYDDDDLTYLHYQTKEKAGDDDHIGFYVDNMDEEDIDDYNILSIEEFTALADDYSPQYKTTEDILAKLKELNNLLNSK